jgi:hypothetical protein
LVEGADGRGGYTAAAAAAAESPVKSREDIRSLL